MEPEQGGSTRTYRSRGPCSGEHRFAQDGSELEQGPEAGIGGSVPVGPGAFDSCSLGSDSVCDGLHAAATSIYSPSEAGERTLAARVTSTESQTQLQSR